MERKNRGNKGIRDKPNANRKIDLSSPDPSSRAKRYLSKARDINRIIRTKLHPLPLVDYYCLPAPRSQLLRLFINFVINHRELRVFIYVLLFTRDALDVLSPVI